MLARQSGGFAGGAEVATLLKFAGNHRETGKPVLGIGLSRENCENLLEGSPIELTLGDGDGLPALSLVIFAGETDESMTTDMLEDDAITPELIIEDKGLRDVQPVSHMQCETHAIGECDGTGPACFVRPITYKERPKKEVD